MDDRQVAYLATVIEKGFERLSNATLIVAGKNTAHRIPPSFELTLQRHIEQLINNSTEDPSSTE